MRSVLFMAITPIYMCFSILNDLQQGIIYTHARTIPSNIINISDSVDSFVSKYKAVIASTNNKKKQPKSKSEY